MCYFLPETDYYNYYYGGYNQSGTETTAEAQENVSIETQGYCEHAEEQHHITAEMAPANPEQPNESSDFPQTEVWEVLLIYKNRSWAFINVSIDIV